ncbi:MAG: hypothetical protein JWP81_3034 [Ferruginibacter sp.]|nr:hypothetical protein [Ferruginibacter sp.]
MHQLLNTLHELLFFGMNCCCDRHSTELRFHPGFHLSIHEVKVSAGLFFVSPYLY